MMFEENKIWLFYYQKCELYYADIFFIAVINLSY